MTVLINFLRRLYPAGHPKAQEGYLMTASKYNQYSLQNSLQRENDSFYSLELAYLGTKENTSEAAMGQCAIVGHTQ